MTPDRNSVALAAVIALALLVGMLGCAKHHQAKMSTPVEVPPPPVEVYVNEAPPRMPTETTGPAPAPSYCWVPGYWAWQGSWVWVRGAWVIPPHPHATYVPGRWTHRGHGYVWTSGHWR